MADDVATLVLCSTPPSFNAVGYTGGPGSRWKVTKAVKLLKRDLGVLLMVERVGAGYAFVRVDVRLTFPTKRRRDAENYRVLLSKALGDVLVERQVIPDDHAGHFKFGELYISPERGPARTEVLLSMRR